MVNYLDVLFNTRYIYYAAPSTKQILGGEPSDLDPALANPRIKQHLIQQAKAKAAPHGTGLEGTPLLLR